MSYNSSCAPSPFLQMEDVGYVQMFNNLIYSPATHVLHC